MEHGSQDSTLDKIAEPRFQRMNGFDPLRKQCQLVFIMPQQVITVSPSPRLSLWHYAHHISMVMAIRTFPSVVGLPIAAWPLSGLVIVLRIVNGDKIGFTVFGQKVEGVTGPVLLWAFCFLVITFSDIHSLGQKR